MSKVKKVSRKKKKQVQREQISARNSEKSTYGAPDIAPQKCPEIEIESASSETKRLDDERSLQTVKSFSSHKFSNSERGSWLNLLATIFICGLAFVIYSNTLNVPFVFDDRINISDNPAIRITQLTFENLSNSAFESPDPNRPLANVSLALNYYFHEYEVAGYHLVNITIHALTGILLYFLFVITLKAPVLKRTIIRPQITAFAAAVIWLAHPLQTQSVTYVIQRMNSMATMFYILAMLLYVIARLSVSKRKKIFFFVGCAVSGLAGFWSKEIVITLPFFILLYEFYFLQDLDINWFKSKPFIFTATIIILGAIILAGQKLGAMFSYGGRQFTLEQRLLTESRVVIFYISQLFFPAPSRLNLLHDFSTSVSLLKPLSTLFSVMALASLLVLAGWFARSWRLLSFCILWYIGNLALESTVFPLEIIFEHRNYLPSTFVSLMFSWLVMWGLRFTQFKPFALIMLFLIAMTFSYWTYERNSDWHDEETLLIDCLEKAPNVARTQASLGYVLLWQGRLDEATKRFNTALRLNPTSGVKYRIQENMDFINLMKRSPDYNKKYR